jgi:hypothetical protein
MFFAKYCLFASCAFAHLDKAAESLRQLVTILAGTGGGGGGPWPPDQAGGLALHIPKVKVTTSASDVGASSTNWARQSRFYMRKGADSSPKRLFK